MNKEPILIIMAAGMGSRYGGLKQMDPMGRNGEVILDYSIFDAKRAGFKRVIFLIKHEIENDFKRLVGSHLSEQLEVRYAFQELDKLPEGYAVPAERKKPWGTGHAVLCCADLVDAPFAVINADDYYGPEAFRLAYDALTHLEDGDRMNWMMVGYRLKNTLTENGYVARGVCSVDSGDMLQAVVEQTHIISTVDGPMFTEDGETYRRLSPETIVSMNMWGFTPGMIRVLKDGFPAFLDQALKENPVKAEYFLPFAVQSMLEKGCAAVRVMATEDRWLGVTYREDRASVMEAFARMADEGLYPSPLWQ